MDQFCALRPVPHDSLPVSTPPQVWIWYDEDKEIAAGETMHLKYDDDP